MNNAEGRSRPATIRDVAALAEVSAGTVSNVLNRPFYVNTETRERVLRAIDELEFVPRQRARQFRPGRVRTLGISVANLSYPFFVDVALGAESEAWKSGIGVVITNSGSDAKRENQNLDLLVQQRVQGIIISPVDEHSSSLQMLRQRGVPTVFVDRVGEHAGDAWSVVVDDVLGGRLAARHVFERGHRRVMFIGHPKASPKAAQRLEGVKFEARQRGVEVEVLDTGSAWTVQAGREAGSVVADRIADRRPTALVCSNDMVALGAMQSLVRGGLSIPEDIAVVGYDDLEWAKASAPPLTTVLQPREVLGQTAVRMLLKLLADDRVLPRNNHVVLQPELIVRSST